MTVRLDSYQADKGMDAPACEKPMHEGAFGRHHVGIFLRPLFDLLLPGKLWSILAWNLLLQSLAMGGRIEPRGLLQDPRLRGASGGIPTDRQGTEGYFRPLQESRQSTG